MPRLSGSDDLYLLIKSLSKEEKGYFVKFAKRHSAKGSQLLSLFNVISKQEIYNEKEVKKKIKHLPVLKNMLFDKILQSLYMSDNNLSVSRQIERNTAFAGILYERGLRKKSIKLVEQSYSLAVENDLTSRAIVLNDLLGDITVNSLPQAERWDKINEFYSKEVKLIDIMSTHNKLHFEERKALCISRLQTAKEIKEKLKHIDLKALNNPANIKSPKAKLLSLTSLTIYYDMVGDLKNLYRVSKENLTLQKEIYSNSKSKVHLINYIIALMNHTPRCIDTGQINEAAKELEQLKKLPCEHQGIQLHKKYHEVYVQQELFYWRAQYSEGAKFSTQAILLNRLNDFAQDQMYVFSAILRNKSLFYLLSDDMQNAYLSLQDLRIVTKQTNDFKLQTDILITEIIIQLRLGNNAIVSNLLKLLEKLHSKYKVITTHTLASISNIIAGREINPVEDNYMLFNRLPISCWFKSITTKQSFSSTVSAANKETVAKNAKAIK